MRGPTHRAAQSQMERIGGIAGVGQAVGVGEHGVWRYRLGTIR